jgi:hypothetical protein
MKQVKINQVESYKDSQGEHIVAKGKLIDLNHGTILRFNPIIISKTEKIEVGDNYLDDTNTIRVAVTDDKDYWNRRPNYYKILALPEQFSPKQLQAIVDGDEVYVECEEYAVGNYGMSDGEPDVDFRVKLNQQGHIKLFPVKQLVEDAVQNYEGLADAFQDYVELHWEEYNKEIVKAIKYGIELAKKNNT